MHKTRQISNFDISERVKIWLVCDKLYIYIVQIGLKECLMYRMSKEGGGGYC